MQKLLKALIKGKIMQTKSQDLKVTATAHANHSRVEWGSSGSIPSFYNDTIAVSQQMQPVNIIYGKYKKILEDEVFGGFGGANEYEEENEFEFPITKQPEPVKKSDIKDILKTRHLSREERLALNKPASDNGRSSESVEIADIVEMV